MEVKVHQDQKIVEIWLTNREQEDAALRENLRKLYVVWQTRKYTVAQFHSGQDNLYTATHDLLRFNQKRVEELSVRREKRLENPNLSASYCGVLPIQC